MISNEIVKRAQELIGKNRDQVGCSGTHAWCAHFVSNVLRYVGIGDMYDLSCTMLQKKMSQSSEWSEPDTDPKAGDILFFDWDRINEPLPLDHVGIITSYNPNTKVITYVNGNGSSSVYVTKQTISINNASIAYWMRFIGDAENTEPEYATAPPKPAVTYCTVKLEQLSLGCESPSVETLQNLLKDCGYSLIADGNFGKETETAVLAFQKAHNLTADAIVGAKTWKALIEAI